MKRLFLWLWDHGPRIRSFRAENATQTKPKLFPVLLDRVKRETRMQGAKVVVDGRVCRVGGWEIYIGNADKIRLEFPIKDGEDK